MTAVKDIKLLKGGRVNVVSETEFDIAYFSVPDAQTELPVLTYVSAPGGGIGLIGMQQSPSLRANIQGFSRFTPGFDLLGSIYIGVGSGTEDLDAIYVGTDSGSLSLSGYIEGFDFTDLKGFYRAAFSGVPLDLNTFIEPIPPLDLFAQLIGVTGQDLLGTIEAIEGAILPAEIHGLPYLDLLSTIAGFDQLDLQGSVSGNYVEDLLVLVSGLASGSVQLLSSISGFVGINQEDLLEANYIGVGSGQQQLFTEIAGHLPLDLNAFIEPIPPAELLANILGSPSGVDLEAEVSGVLPSGSLTASITGTGGFQDLFSYILPSTESFTILPAIIDGTAVSDLMAQLNSTPQDILEAVINPSGAPNNHNLDASIIPTYIAELGAQYDTSIGNLLQAEIIPISAPGLGAIIIPRVFFIDSSIPINTYAIRDLRAIINATDCDFNSAFSDLQVMISGTSFGDLSAEIIAIAGQYAIAEDMMDILIKNYVITEDWIPFIIDQPAIAETLFPVILTNSPLSDLTASILGVPNSTDLSASITPLYFSNVARDSLSIIEWVNTKTGERKIVRIFFTGDATTYYYSEEANEAFSFSPEDRMVVTVQTYDKIEDDDIGRAYLAEKTNVSSCTVDNLQDFPTLDDAIRYGIVCALGQISKDLTASIVGTGDTSTLTASINPLNPNKLKDLKAKYTAVINQPDLEATISGSGGFEDLAAYIRSNFSTSTGPSIITNTMGERFIPKLITHGDGTVSVVLTKVLSTDTLINNTGPDLSAHVTGVAESYLEASVSGTV